MALIDNIMEELTGMGFGTSGSFSYGDIASLTQPQIAGQLQSYYGLESQDLPGNIFSPITEDLLKQGLSSTYSPIIESAGTTLASQLADTLGGEQGRKAHGDFAHSGGAEKYTQQAHDVYGKGMSDVLVQTGQQQMKGLTGIRDMINQWKETALKIRGDI